MLPCALSFPSTCIPVKALNRKTTPFSMKTVLLTGPLCLPLPDMALCAPLPCPARTRRFYGSCVMRKFVREHSHGERPDSLNRKPGSFRASAARASRRLLQIIFANTVFLFSFAAPHCSPLIVACRKKFLCEKSGTPLIPQMPSDHCTVKYNACQDAKRSISQKKVKKTLQTWGAITPLSQRRSDNGPSRKLLCR